MWLFVKSWKHVQSIMDKLMYIAFMVWVFCYTIKASLAVDMFIMSDCQFIISTNDGRRLTIAHTRNIVKWRGCAGYSADGLTDWWLTDTCGSVSRQTALRVSCFTFVRLVEGGETSSTASQWGLACRKWRHSLILKHLKKKRTWRNFRKTNRISWASYKLIVLNLIKCIFFRLPAHLMGGVT